MKPSKIFNIQRKKKDIKKKVKQIKKKKSAKEKGQKKNKQAEYQKKGTKKFGRKTDQKEFKYLSLDHWIFLNFRINNVEHTSNKKRKFTCP